MKRIILTFLAVAFALLASQAHAVYPNVVIKDGQQIVLDYNGKPITVVTPTVATNSQHNHDVNLNSNVNVTGNWQPGPIKVDSTAVLNNISVNGQAATNTLQVNQTSNAASNVNVSNNTMTPGAEITVNSTAAGNVLNTTSPAVQAVQVNHGGSISSSVTVSGNNWAVGIDPKVDSQAIGNSIAVDATGSITAVTHQQNVGTNVASNVNVNSNVRPGAINVTSTAVGNNLTIGKK